MKTFATRLDPRANSLNAIRLVLATTVIVSHSWSIGEYGITPTHGGLAPGGWAVDAFFVLSGYLITGSRLNNDLTSYIKRRVLRIYPGFAVCLLSVVLIFAPIGYFHAHHTLSGYLSKPNTPIDFLVADVGLKMRLFGVAGTPSGPHAWTGSLWSLYYEFLCYMIVGLLACWIAYRRKPAVAITVFALATVISLEYGHHLVKYASSADVAHMVRLVPFFMAGSVIYLLRDHVPCVWWLAVPSVVGLVFIPWGGGRLIVLCALPLTYLLLYLGAVVPVAIGRRNDISYGIYMYGYPVEQLMRFPHFASQTLYTILTIIATLPIAAASWFIVERPAMRWRSGTKPPAPPVSTAGDPGPIAPFDAPESIPATGTS